MKLRLKKKDARILLHLLSHAMNANIGTAEEQHRCVKLQDRIERKYPDLMKQPESITT